MDEHAAVGKLAFHAHGGPTTGNQDAAECEIQASGARHSFRNHLKLLQSGAVGEESMNERLQLRLDLGLPTLPVTPELSLKIETGYLFL